MFSFKPSTMFEKSNKKNSGISPSSPVNSPPSSSSSSLSLLYSHSNTTPSLSSSPAASSSSSSSSSPTTSTLHDSFNSHPSVHTTSANVIKFRDPLAEAQTELLYSQQQRIIHTPLYSSHNRSNGSNTNGHSNVSSSSNKPLPDRVRSVPEMSSGTRKPLIQPDNAHARSHSSNSETYSSSTSSLLSSRESAHAPHSSALSTAPSSTSSSSSSSASLLSSFTVPGSIQNNNTSSPPPPPLPPRTHVRHRYSLESHLPSLSSSDFVSSSLSSSSLSPTSSSSSSSRHKKHNSDLPSPSSSASKPLSSSSLDHPHPDHHHYRHSSQHHENNNTVDDNRDQEKVENGLDGNDHKEYRTDSNHNYTLDHDMHRLASFPSSMSLFSTTPRDLPVYHSACMGIATMLLYLVLRMYFSLSIALVLIGLFMYFLLHRIDSSPNVSPVPQLLNDGDERSNDTHDAMTKE